MADIITPTTIVIPTMDHREITRLQVQSRADMLNQRLQDGDETCLIEMIPFIIREKIEAEYKAERDEIYKDVNMNDYQDFTLDSAGNLILHRTRIPFDTEDGFDWVGLTIHQWKNKARKFFGCKPKEFHQDIHLYKSEEIKQRLLESDWVKEYKLERALS